MKSTLSSARKTASQFWKPHEYQLRAVQRCIEVGAQMLILDPGLGKTSITLAVASLLRQKKIIRRTLIIAPLRVCQLVWPAELKKWSDFAHLSLNVLHGKDKEKLFQQQADIDVINPDGLEWLLAHPNIEYDMLVVDESTMFKNTQSKRFKLLKKHLNKFQRRYCLTGTPASNGLEDLFGQVYVLDQGGTFGRYVTHFRQEFFFATGFGGYTLVPKPHAEERIYEKLSPLATRMAASDYLELPPLINNTILVELPPTAARCYAEMEQQFLTELLDGTTITAVNAAVKSGKLRQIAAGGLFLPSGEEWENLHMEKTTALRELTESIPGRPVLVAFEFQHDLDRLQQEFGKDLPYIAGGVNEKRVKELEREWNLGRLPILAGHPRSMGHGLNLQERSDTVVWLTPTWDLELHDQFIRRVWRQGNKAPHVNCHYLIAQGTVDEAVMLAIANKSRTQNSLLLALREYATLKANHKESHHEARNQQVQQDPVRRHRRN
jgi:SNF2 family DNA or RNA helicase